MTITVTLHGPVTLHLFLVLLCCPFIGTSQVRKYKPGDTYKYKLTTDVYRNDKYAGKTISVSEHRVVQEGDVPGEEIKWLSKMTINGKDTIRLDSIAQTVAPYRISLLPEGKVLLPKLTIPQMVGEVTDLNTFFVAIAPALNADKLTSKNPVITNAEWRQGNFADSIFILYGTDCIEVKQRLVSATRQYNHIQTLFSPPDSFCLTPLIDTVARKTYDFPNNFQMIQKGEGDKVNVFWGVETFVINTKIDNRNGAILHATMDNVLNLRMRYNSTPDLKSYAVEMPVTIKRSLRLELLR
ncbi:hypothetical protein [Longitalea luteola]|uniref:hypothetical protein n=1 Tax=Longitalea luteola TaxID=2812563 RepID=UPI001A978C58|nr:hypothetical protein [Longitalea luteola]